MLRVTGPKSTSECTDDQICAGFKAVINGYVHGVQAIWGKNSSTEDWGFLLVYAKNVFNEINQIRMLWRVCHLDPSVTSLFLTVIFTGH